MVGFFSLQHHQLLQQSTCQNLPSNPTESILILCGRCQPTSMLSLVSTSRCIHLHENELICHWLLLFTHLAVHIPLLAWLLVKRTQLQSKQSAMMLQVQILWNQMQQKRVSCKDNGIKVWSCAAKVSLKRKMFCRRWPVFYPTMWKQWNLPKLSDWLYLPLSTWIHRKELLYRCVSVNKWLYHVEL